MVNHMYGLLARCFWEYLLFFLLHALINQSLNIQRVRPCAGRRVLGDTGLKAPDQNVEQIRTSVAKWTLLILLGQMKIDSDKKWQVKPLPSTPN